MFKKSRAEVDKWVSKVDKLVTGLIIWGAIGSLFWLSKGKEWKDVAKVVVDSSKVAWKVGMSLFGKGIIRLLKIFEKNEK